jgi:tetratricopeptide (TPR) repeat protein
VVDRYPNSEYAEVATLNRAILAVRGGRAADTLPELGRLVNRGVVSPYVGRARATRGAALLATGKPAEAERDFQAALGQGETGLAQLGLGSASFARGQWDQAARQFADARDAGAGPVADAAGYGLAAVLFNLRKIDEFKQVATPMVAGPVDPATTPRLVHAPRRGRDRGEAVERRADVDLRLADQFPRYEGTQPALTQLAAAAGGARQWALSRDMYAKLGERFPGSRPARQPARLRGGAAAHAGRRGPPHARAGAAAGTGQSPSVRASMLLAEAQEATGDRAAALDTYTRVGRPRAPGRRRPRGCSGKGGSSPPTASGTRRAAGSSRRSTRATGRAAEAAYRLGEGYRSTGKRRTRPTCI